MDIYGFWRDVLAQDAQSIRSYFTKDARIFWHCTNEQFTLEEFIIANCEYPGEWDGRVERVEQAQNALITVARVYPKYRSLSFHVVSFFRLAGDKIETLDEYWADDGAPPVWRQERRIGQKIL